jgi:hypothetical protein
MSRAAALGLLLLACATRLPDWKAGTLTPTERVNAKTTPWYRIEDAIHELPIYVVLATDRTVCLVSAADWAVAQSGDVYPCAGRWRMERIR